MEKRKAMAKSKWTKTAMLEEIQALNLSDLDADAVSRLRADDLRGFLSPTDDSGRVTHYYIDPEKLPRQPQPATPDAKSSVSGEYRSLSPLDTGKKIVFREVWVHFEGARVDGDWIVLKNGQRRKKSNVKLENPLAQSAFLR